MSELIIHIGVPKTGTTAVQGYLYQNRARLAELGIYYPETFLDGFSIQDQWAHHLHAHKWGGWLNQGRFKTKPDLAWQSLREEMSAMPGRYIISSERFGELIASSRGSEVLDFITTYFPGVEMKFISYIRRQDVLAESFLKQTVKVNVQKRSLEQYINDLPPFLDYYRLFSTLAQYVGWENICVRLYERDRLVGQDAAQDFLVALNISDFNYGADKAFVANESTSTLATRVFLELANSGVLRARPKFRYWLGNFLNDYAFRECKDTSLFDEKVRSEIIEKYSEGNSLLAKKLVDPSAVIALLEMDEQGKPALNLDDAVFSIRQVCDLIERFHSHDWRVGKH